MKKKNNETMSSFIAFYLLRFESIRSTFGINKMILIEKKNRLNWRINIKWKDRNPFRNWLLFRFRFLLILYNPISGRLEFGILPCLMVLLFAISTTNFLKMFDLFSQSILFEVCKYTIGLIRCYRREKSRLLGNNHHQVFGTLSTNSFFSMFFFLPKQN